MQTVMVFGAGTMGSGIAQVAATAGYRTLLCDVSDEFAQRGFNGIAAGLDKQVAKGKLTPEGRQAILDNLIPCSGAQNAAEADIILEAVFENVDVKKSLYADIEKYARPDALIGTNTSFIPITKLAEDMEHPERLIGIHFFVPVYAMKLVELILGKKTSEETLAKARAYVESIKKESVLVKVDSAGFIVNRINYATYSEAFKVMQEGVASIEDIDKAMRLGLNHPMGPFELIDFAGLKTLRDCYAIFYELTGDERYAPVPELDEHVEKGELGKKTGKGWYDYTK